MADKKECNKCKYWDKELIEKFNPLDDGSPRYTGLPEFISVCKKRLLRTRWESICKWFERN